MESFIVKVELDNVPTDEQLDLMSDDECKDLCLENNWFLPIDKNGVKVDPKEWIRCVRSYATKSFPTLEDLDNMDEDKMRLFSFIKGWIYPWEINYFSMTYKVKFNIRTYLDEVLKEFNDGSGNIDKEKIEDVLKGDHEARLAFIDRTVQKIKR